MDSPYPGGSLVSDFLTSACKVAFDAGQLTSDGGLVWLARADERLGLSAAFAGAIRDWRRGPARHALPGLLPQRILHIPSSHNYHDDPPTLHPTPFLNPTCVR